MRILGASIVLVLLVALSARVAACIVWADDLTHDRDAYLGIAQQVAAGAGFCTPGTTAPTAYRPPLYPLVLATAMAMFPPAVAVAVVNIVAGLVTVWATWGMATALGLPRRWSIVASAVVACDPLLIRYAAQPMTECVFTALVATFLWMLVAPGAWGWPHAFGTGVVGGLSALCRPTLWPFLLAVVVGFVVLRSTRWRKSIAFMAGVALVSLPWVVRNQRQFETPVLTTTHGGYTLLLANNPVFYGVARKGWGSTWDGHSLEAWQHAMLFDADRELGEHAGEAAVDRWQARQAWRHIADDRAGFVAAVVYRVRSLWSVLPRGEARLSGPQAWLIGSWYAVLFALAAMGTVRALRNGCRPVIWLLLFVASVQAVHLFYWTDTRMRAPLHPVLAVLAALAVRPSRPD